MRKGRRWLRCSPTIGAFAASVMLALIVPSMAFAANTATFSLPTPSPGSSSKAARPYVSVVGYDRFGVRGARLFWMTIDGDRQVARLAYFRGYGYRKFRIGYTVKSALPVGTHRVVVKVRDLEHRDSTYAWSFTVLESVPPVTTDDAASHNGSAGPATVHLSATDTGGSGVAHTYYKLDGGAQTEGTAITVSGLGFHTIEYWSVDALDNTEAHNVSFFFVTAAPASDVTPPVTTSDAVASYVDSATVTLSATDNAGGSGVAHTYYKLDGGAQTEGTAITVSTAGFHTLEFWSVDAGSNAEVHHVAGFFVNAPVSAFVHPKPEISCTVAGCHVLNVAAIHSGLNNGCAVCHANDVAPKSTCTDAACHGTTPPPFHGVGTHVPINSTGTPSCTQSVCHGDAGMLVIHTGGCAVCHNSANPVVTAAIASGNATCESCHNYAAIHTIPAGSHTVSGSCFSSNCHFYTDVSLIHTKGDDPPGCFVCHGAGITPSKVCLTCHPTLVDIHSFVHVDASGTNSAGCTACHGTDLPTVHTALGCFCHTSSLGSSMADEMAPLLAAGTAECVDCHVGPYAPHTDAHVTLQGEIAANSAGCVSCHGSNILDIQQVTGEHKGCSCHAYHEAEGKMACEDCHTKPMDPSAPYPYHVGAHATLEAGISGTTSSACVSCHGTDLLDIGAGPHTVGEHKSCSCHAYGEATPANTECADCHEDAYAPHGFVDGVSHTGTGWTAASGHNTTTYGGFGALTKWDGSEGVVVKDSTNSTITQEWPLPSGAVFWSQVDHTKADPTTDAAPSTANTTVGWGSVITCQDCHTGLVGVVGPQGANVANVGLDPNYPDDWKTAEITSFDPTGMRSIATTAGSPNPYYTKEGSKILPNGAFDVTTTVSSNGYSSGDIAGKYICQKCHKLVSPYQGIAIAGNGRGFRSNNFAYMGFSNEVHMEHHADTINGQANCISCHIGIPHGWKRPRLLVYETDSAPYMVSQLPTSSPVVANETTYTNAGNWAYFANTGMNGWKGSSHLDALNAASTAAKEDTMGVASGFASADATAGTTWGNWSTTGLGIEWEPDSNVVAKLALNTPDVPEIQNNCNACSATGATHTDPSIDSSTAPAGTREGFTPATTAPVPTTFPNYLAPAWR